MTDPSTPQDEGAGTTTAAEDLVAQSESGARVLTGGAGMLVAGLCIAWSVFQLYIASDIPFWLQVNVGKVIGIDFIFNNVQARRVHLAFALILAALSFPLLKSSSRHSLPWYDWVLAILGASACLYILVFQDAIAVRAGLPTAADKVMSVIGLVVLLIATYRALGLPLLCVVSVFLLYVFFGDRSFFPEVIQWKGASFGKAMWHMWMQEEGIFGVAVGVSTSLIFLFVLFGSILEKAGAGHYFIKVAFALLGTLRGGPAKAAVMASALSGLYSGSSIANVVTTGTFTIPLMKRTGFSAEKAGAIEVASSTNGQLTPPVMGAAAFLIAEFTDISYLTLIKHAFLPAIISYIALLYITHLEAIKMGLEGLPRPSTGRTLRQKLLGFLTGFIAVAVLFLVVYYGLGWIKVAFPGLTVWMVLLIFLAAYLLLAERAARYPDLEVEDPNAAIDELPPAGATAITGLYYIIPIVVLIWMIMIERLSPAVSAFWAALAMMVITFTQHAVKGAFRGDHQMVAHLRQGFMDVVGGFIAGARNMIPIAVATAAAGIIIGTVALTGAHQVIGAFVEFLSQGSLILMLLLVAVMSLVLGMGLPTTANYIVVSSLMAPVIVTVGAQNGLILPLVAAHMFVFYFGILADDTPPVGLAAFAAGAISGGDPIKTGIQGFAYDIRTAILPFLFVFNTELLLIDVTWQKSIFVFIVAVIAMLLFAAATQGYFLARSRIWETVALLLIAFTLFRPGFWLDMVSPPFDESPGAQIEALAGGLPAGDDLRLSVSGPDFDNPDKIKKVTLIVPLAEAGPGLDRMSTAGLQIIVDEGVAAIEEPFPNTPFFTDLQRFDFYGDVPVKIDVIRIATERWAKELFYIPALILLAFVCLLQWRRAEVPPF
jgi:TRAP transporter 4TM/12TM fusion protein